jgi:molybdenum cofactor cytidylyltransferase
MGEPKQLLSYRGVSLVRRAALAALGSRCRPVHVVLGANADAVAASLEGLDVVQVANAAWAEGLSSSIARGVSSLLERGSPAAALLVLCDQPFVTSAVLDRLLDAFDGSAEQVVASRYAGVLGTPALFGAAHFPALRQLVGDRGARSLLEVESGSLRVVDFALGEVDVDTPDDWRALAGDAAIGDEEDAGPTEHPYSK